MSTNGQNSPSHARLLRIGTALLDVLDLTDFGSMLPTAHSVALLTRSCFSVDIDSTLDDVQEGKYMTVRLAGQKVHPVR